MAWDSSDLLLAGSTAIFGLVAGQTGAWVQSRRDAKTQAARDIAENERLAQQLAAADRESTAQRVSADVRDWRGRRIDAYAAVSTLAAVLEEPLHDIAIPDPWGASQSTEVSGLHEAGRELDAAIYAAKLISNAQCRAAGENLADAADAAIDATAVVAVRRDFVEQKKKAEGLSEPERRSSLVDPSEQLQRAEQDLRSDEEKARALLITYAAARESWENESRRALGMAD